MLRHAIATAALAILASTVALPHAASAQTRDDLDRRARSEFNAGRDAFSHGNYEEAARRFEDAYQFSQRAQLFYNIGTTYDRLHRWVNARDAFRHYLEAFPNAAERDEVRGRLVVIEQEIARDERRQSSSPDVVVLHDAPVRVIVRNVPAESHTLRNVALIVGGLGVISGIVVLVQGITTTQHYNELAMSCGQTAAGCLATDIDDIRFRQVIINLFSVAGGVLGVASVAMLVVNAVLPRHESSSAPTARVRLAPWIAGDAAGRALTGGGLVISGAL